jgi:CheY-like chemotaxis protein
LVEDDEINQAVADELMTQAGLVVSIASSGGEALAALGAERPQSLEEVPFDLVLMDLHMPGIDGFETTRRIRSHARLASLPIIAMTADVVGEVSAQCSAAGMNDYVSKPIDPDELVRVLGRWVRKPGITSPPKMH